MTKNTAQESTANAVPALDKTVDDADLQTDPAQSLLFRVQQCLDELRGQDALDLLDAHTRTGQSDNNDEADPDAYLDPDDLLVQIIRADTLRLLGRFSEASAHYRLAAEKGGEHAALALRRDGECLIEAKKLSEALQSLRRSLSIEDDVYAHYLLAQLLFSSTLQFSAVCHARHLLEETDDDTMLATAENVYRFAMLPLEAYEVVKRRAHLGEPGTFLGLLLCGAQGILDWDTAESYTRQLEEQFYSKGDFSTSREIPLYNIARVADEAVNLAVARESVKEHMDVLPAFDLSRHWTEHEPRLRVGLLSADFHAHPVIQLIIGLFEHLDKERFELYAYDDGKNDTDGENRLLAVVDRHVDVREQTDKVVARKVYDDKIDVLIDLMGLTTKNRQGVMALRPCPVTAGFLGFPGTSGLPSMDYVITDAVITPDSSKPHYAEKLCRLPEVFMPNDQKRVIADNPVCRADLGLPEDRVVFCSFNRSFKLDKQTVHLWMRVLSRVPGSVLWQKADEPNMMRVFKETAALYGVAPERIIFAGNTGSVPLHLSRAALADIGLDTLIYNGHTITADLLWAGVPVVTCTGNHFASRVSTSLLRAAGLPELAAPTPQAMEDLAVALALNPARRRELRQRLEVNRGTLPLFDTERYARHFEQALTMMLDRARQGLPPDHIDVPALPPRNGVFLPDGPPRVTEANMSATECAYADMTAAQLLQKTPYGIHFGTCPACDRPKDIVGIPVRVSDHPHWLPHLPAQVFWLSCPHCGHSYVNAFWDCGTRRALRDHAAAEPDTARIIRRRAALGPLMRHVWHRHNGPELSSDAVLHWLDLGSDDGSWPFVASGFGFAVTAVDCAPSLTNRLQALGLPAWEQNPLCSNLNEKLSVISISVLERQPYPDIVLSWADAQLEDNGTLVLACHLAVNPMANLVDLTEQSVLLKDPRRLHLFNRKSLYTLLRRNGFAVDTVFPDPDDLLRLYIVAKKAHTVAHRSDHSSEAYL